MADQLGQLGPPTGMRGQWLHDGVTGEFGVTFPFDGVTVAAQSQKIALQLLQAKVTVPRQTLQQGPLLFTTHPCVEHGHIGDQCRQPHPRRGTGMDFVVQLAPQGIVQGQGAGVDFVHGRIVGPAAHHVEFHEVQADFNPA